MSFDINLMEYKVLLDDTGCVTMNAEGLVILQHLETKKEVCVTLPEVAPFYNLRTISGETKPAESDDSHNVKLLNDDHAGYESEFYGETIIGVETQPVESDEVHSMRWSDDQTKFVLDLYAEFIDLVGPSSRFRLKKHLWQFIAEKMFEKFGINVSWSQVETRYKTVMRRTKKGMSNQTISDNSYYNWNLSDDDQTRCEPDRYAETKKYLKKRPNQPDNKRYFKLSNIKNRKSYAYCKKNIAVKTQPPHPDLKWTDDQTSCILDIYDEFIYFVGPSSRFRLKRHLWEFIAEKITEKFGISVSWTQVESRFKTIMKRTKKGIPKKYTNDDNLKLLDEDQTVSEPDFYDEANIDLQTQQANQDDNCNLSFLNDEQPCSEPDYYGETNIDLKTQQAQTADNYNLKFSNDDETCSSEPDLYGGGVIEKPQHPDLKWSHKQTRFVLDLYGKFIHLVGPSCRFRLKRNLWQFIAEKVTGKFGTNVSWIQVESRYKTVMKRTKKQNSKINTSENNYNFNDDDKPCIETHFYGETNTDLKTQPEPPDDNYDLKFLNEDPKYIETNIGDMKAQPAHADLKWSDEQTRYVLDLYDEFIHLVGPSLRFALKKNLWHFIAEKIREKFGITVSWSQVETRFKTIKKRMRKGLVLNDKAILPKVYTSSDVCRICMESSDEYIDFSKSFAVNAKRQPLTLRECFVETTRLCVDPLEDELPQQLCPTCGLELQEFYDFLKRARNADRVLKNSSDKPRTSVDLKQNHQLSEKNFKDSSSHSLNELNECILLPSVETKLSDTTITSHLEISAITNDNGFAIDENYLEVEIATPYPDNDEEEMFQCTECKKGFLSQFVLNLHIKRMHKSEPNVEGEEANCEDGNEETYPSLHPIDTQTDNVLSHNKSNLVIENIECTICGKAFSDVKTRREHIISVHKAIISEKSKRDVSGNAVTEIEENMRSHLLSTSRADYVRCGKCLRLTPRYSFKEHMAGHERDRKFHCTSCYNYFPSLHLLQKHIKTNHAIRAKTISCSLCPKKFYKTNALKLHMITHTKIERCKCDVCGKRFLRKGGLRRHLLMHKGGVAQEKCTECSKTYLTKGELRVHMRSHTHERPYMCEICGKGFALQGPLTYHMRRHTGQNFPCEYCDRVFLTQGSCRKHTYKHIGLPFICPKGECKRGFNTKKRLSEHVKKKHNSELTMEDLHQIYNNIENSRLK